MPKSKSRRPRKMLSPYHRKKRAEAKRKRELKKQCNSTIQNTKGSTTYKVLDIDEQPNDIFGKLNQNCANCDSNFEHENERNFKLKTDKHTHTYEVEIIDAIFYIYGLTVSDWSNTLSLEDEESDFTSASEIVFSNGIVFCSKCTLALENVYTSHKRLKELGHDDSLFVKTLSKKYSREIESKVECDDENEVSSLNKTDLFDEELEVKDEDDSEETNVSMFEFQDSFLEANFESNQMDDPLAVAGFDSLQSSNNISHNVSEKNIENTLVPNNVDNVSLTDMQRKTNKQTDSRIKSKILERQRYAANVKRSTIKSSLTTAYKSNEESSRSVYKTRRLTKNLSVNRVLQKGKPKQVLRKPKPTLHHPFHILCCDESFVSKEAFANHQLKSHSTDVEKPKLVKCNICEILIPYDAVENHMETWRYLKKYFKCKTCDSQFKNTKELTDHLQTHGPEYKIFICDVCEAPMQSDFQLLLHKSKNHSNSESSGACIVCEKLFPSWFNLRRHMKNMHEERLDKDYKCICIKCNRRFSSEFYLSIHRKRSIDCSIATKRSVCEKCGKSVTTGKMQRHLHEHEDMESSNKELFRCSQCGKMLKHGHSLRKHIFREHPVKEKLFFCEKCGKTTKNMTNMRIHMKVHEKE